MGDKHFNFLNRIAYMFIDAGTWLCTCHPR